jgi:hypothetical protein
VSVTNYPTHRARVAVLTRYRDADDPELATARVQMHEERFVAAVERALASAPPITPQVRDRVIALLAPRTPSSSASTAAYAAHPKEGSTSMTSNIVIAVEDLKEADLLEAKAKKSTNPDEASGLIMVANHLRTPPDFPVHDGPRTEDNAEGREVLEEFGVITPRTPEDDWWKTLPVRLIHDQGGGLSAQRSGQIFVPVPRPTKSYKELNAEGVSDQDEVHRFRAVPSSLVAPGSRRRR